MFQTVNKAHNICKDGGFLYQLENLSDFWPSGFYAIFQLFPISSLFSRLLQMAGH